MKDGIPVSDARTHGLGQRTSFSKGGIFAAPPGLYWQRKALPMATGWEGADLLGGSTNIPENDGLARVSAPSAVALPVRADAACDSSWRHCSSAIRRYVPFGEAPSLLSAPSLRSTIGHASFDLHFSFPPALDLAPVLVFPKLQDSLSAGRLCSPVGKLHLRPAACATCPRPRRAVASIGATFTAPHP
jgi:hypothetical protein